VNVVDVILQKSPPTLSAGSINVSPKRLLAFDALNAKLISVFFFGRLDVAYLSAH
jgi:hypothetical protein